ncbi:ABC transporter ATP-binding protein [Actinokineospora pegani]|uniref:ABC transporter ATP-binding protein n=1 Tax=Actinokineospora pegani TaxID=2654637 RepID=UPI0038B3EC4A
MMLGVEGLSVHYGSVTAVSDVDLMVADGEVLALLGPSGCGKSTLLRAVAGLQECSGAVRWDGADLAKVPVHRRGFGLVFQDGQLFPHRDVAGNIAFGLRMAGVGKAARVARVAELLELVGLAGYASRRVGELSGGERQRVALARALAPRPRLLLLDEPLSALDRALREHLAVDLARVLRLSGTTALVVTHDHDEAFTLADRVALMRGGVIRQVGAPGEVWGRPVDAETARFLGCGRVLDAGELAAFGGVPWAGQVGLRESALRVAADGPVAGEVTAAVHRRDHVRLVVATVGLGQVDAVAGIAEAPRVGDSVSLRLDESGVVPVG